MYQTRQGVATSSTFNRSDSVMSTRPICDSAGFGRLRQKVDPETETRQILPKQGSNVRARRRMPFRGEVEDGEPSL
jgi:hypothetical protein